MVKNEKEEVEKIKVIAIKAWGPEAAKAVFLQVTSLWMAKQLRILINSRMGVRFSRKATGS